MLIRVVIIFLLVMVVIAMIGRQFGARPGQKGGRSGGIRLPGRKCPACGAWNVGRKPCGCGGERRG